MFKKIKFFKDKQNLDVDQYENIFFVWKKFLENLVIEIKSKQKV